MSTLKDFSSRTYTIDTIHQHRRNCLDTMIYAFPIRFFHADLFNILNIRIYNSGCT